MKKKNTLLEDIALLIILLINFLNEKTKILDITQSVIKIVAQSGLQRISDVLKRIKLRFFWYQTCYNFFLGWHVFKANITALFQFKCVERFESHVKFFSFKFNFLGFSNNFVPDFENMYYLLD